MRLLSSFEWIPTYLLSLFRVLVSMSKRLEKFMSDFVWEEGLTRGKVQCSQVGGGGQVVAPTFVLLVGILG